MEMRGRDIICFANDWDGDPLSKKHLMVRLARDNRVLWVNSLGCRNPQASTRDLRRILSKVVAFGRGLRQEAPNLWVFGPLAIPFHSSPAARWINEKWLVASLRLACRWLGFRDPVVWSFIPSSADVATALPRSLLVYHCVDEFSEFTGTDAATITAMEAKLASHADVVFVSAGSLLETKRKLNPNTFLVTHGVDVDHFRQALDPATSIPADLVRGEGPVIGFFGLVEDWVDLDLVRHLAVSRPHWSMVLIGKVATDLSAVRDLANVVVLGRRSYQDLPAYCRGFDAAILPFRINPLTIAANPLKLREYLAAGLPVVATAIPEAARLEPLVRVGTDPEHFLAHLDAILTSGKTGPQHEISQAMDQETWDSKLEELARVLSRFVDRSDAAPAELGSARSLA
jgi:glycosyltransferase involved in cell wall biosynthesis